MNNERLGEIRNNKFGTPMKIIRYGCYNDIDVEFLDENHYIKEHNITNGDELKMKINKRKIRVKDIEYDRVNERIISIKDEL